MAYLIERNGNYKIVDYMPHSGYLDMGSRKELEERWNEKLSPEEARKRQIKFLKEHLTPEGEEYLKRKGTYKDMNII